MGTRWRCQRSMSVTVKDLPSGVAEQWMMMSVIFLMLFLFEFVVEIGTEFGVFGLNVDGDTEDGASVNQALGEDAEDGLVDLAGGRYDETRDGEGEAADEHGDCGAVLDCFFCGGFHFF